MIINLSELISWLFFFVLFEIFSVDILFPKLIKIVTF